jgi:hypothetical protein
MPLRGLAADMVDPVVKISNFDIPSARQFLGDE